MAEAQITETLIGFEETRRYDALYDDGTLLRLEALALFLRTTQPMYDHPVLGPIPQGEPTESLEVGGYDLREGEFVDVRSDPNFDKIQRA